MMSTGLLYGRDPADDSEWLVWEQLERRRTHAPGQRALVFEVDALTFGGLAAQAEAVAASLQELGVHAGDVVSYQLPNWAEACVVMLAAQRIGAVANPIVPIYRRREVDFILRQARSKVLFAPGVYRGFDHGAMARELAQNTDLTVVACRDPGAPLRYEDLLAAATAPRAGRFNPDADAFLIYTSGTEGEPKGVRHSQRTLLADASSIIAEMAITPADRFYLATPLTHVTGLLYGQLTPLLAGIDACIADRWDPCSAAAVIAQHRCTLMCGATPFLQGLIENPDVCPEQIASLRAFRCGGADVPAALVRAAHKRGVFALRTYGSTEHPSVTGSVSQDEASAADTDGRIHAHCEVRIAPDPAAGEGAGEVQTRGPELFLGYKDAALDGAAFTKDGWYRTGDLGTLSPEGALTIIGRKKDVIVRKGENISAREIEDILLTHPAVASAAVIGLPDPERGEMVAAACVLAPGAACAPQRLREHVAAAGVAPQKIPERIEIVERMPMTAAGKIRKSELRACFLSQTE